MKKLFILTFALAYIMNITAAEPINKQLVGLGEKPHYKDLKEYLSQLPPATRAGESVNNLYGYCLDIDITRNNAFGMGQNYIGAVMEGVMEIPAEVAQKWKGSTVTGVNIGFGQAQDKNINVYITKDLEGVPVLLENAVIEKEFAWNLISLQKPYEIDGDGFFIGYQVNLTTVDTYPLTVDFNPFASVLGDIVGLNYYDENNQPVTIYNHLIGAGLGSVCLQAEIDGKTVPNLDIFPEDFYHTDYAIQNQTFDAILTFENIGLSTITAVDIESKINGVVQNDMQVTLFADIYSETDHDVDFGRPGFVLLEGLKATGTGSVPVELLIKSVTGEDGKVADLNLSITSELLVPATTYDKNIVVEEFTGTWCPNCPRGMVGMAYMEEKYGDKGFIGIAVHYNDEMQTSSYFDVVYQYSENRFPSAVADRSEYFDPGKDTLEEIYNNLRQVPALAKVEVTAQYDEVNNVVKATATTEYGFSGANQNNNYALAFVITENNVGPYIQENGYSGQNIDMGGWETKPMYVPTLFNHVARDIWFAFGIEDSQPEEITEKTPYSFDLNLPLNNVKDVNECEVIALLLNHNTGEIINAGKFSLHGQAGVDALTVEPEDGIFKAYNLQGVKVLETKNSDDINNLPKGFYIVNGKKVVVK